MCEALFLGKDFLKGILLSALSSWAHPLSLCLSHSADKCLQADAYKPSASVTHKLEVGLTREGGVTAGRHCSAQRPHDLISQLVKTLVIER